jgi:hypothetical protein
MVADPDLRPTTAIKTLGITDPSVIRRLRDKFHAAERQLIAELRGEAATEPSEPLLPFMTDTGPTVGELRTGVRAMPLAQPAEARKSAPMAPLPIPASPLPTTHTPQYVTPIEAAPVRASQTAPAALADVPSWIGVGLSMYAFGVGAQCALLNTMFPWLPMAAAVQSHAALTQYAIAMGCSPAASSCTRQSG